MTDKVTLASVDTPAVPFLVTLKVVDCVELFHYFVKFLSLSFEILSMGSSLSNKVSIR